MKDLCFSGLTGEIITPENPEYNEARQEYNRRIQKFPIAIVFCSNYYDVINAVLWCKKHNICLRIRNGRHNYEGYSVGNCVLVIDVSRMSHMVIDEENNLLFAEGGVNISELYDFVSSKGYPFPGGSCPTVGLAAYAMGGGFGYSSRFLGLGCDSLVEITLVNDEGQIITANSKQNSDLFWACRGGGSGNFGVVISMQFTLPPKVDRVTYIEIHYPGTDRDKQEDFWSIWQDWLETADRRITLTAVLSNSAKEGLDIFSRGIFYGEPAEAVQIVQPLLEPGGELILEYISFLDALKKIGSVYPESEKFKTTGRFAYEHFSAQTIHELVDFIQAPPIGSVLISLNLYALGGKVADVNPCDTAFFYRHARYIIAIQAVWEDDVFEDNNITWVDVHFKDLEDVTFGSFVNFPYQPLPEYMDEYYGGNSCRLKQVKCEYDSENLFQFQQSIPLVCCKYLEC